MVLIKNLKKIMLGVPKVLSERIHYFSLFFFHIQFRNTSNFIFLGFKVSSERFFHKNFKTSLFFLCMWF